MQVIVHILHANPLGGHRIIGPGKFRIKSGIRRIRLIEQLIVKPDARLRPDIAQKQRFSPPRVRHDHIRRESRVSKLYRGHHTGLSAMQLGIQINQPRMHPIPRFAGDLIRQDPHALPIRRLFHTQSQRNAAVPTCRQGGGKILKLARKILMDE